MHSPTLTKKKKCIYQKLLNCCKYSNIANFTTLESTLIRQFTVRSVLASLDHAISLAKCR